MVRSSELTSSILAKVSAGPNDLFMYLNNSNSPVIESVLIKNKCVIDINVHTDVLNKVNMFTAPHISP